MAKPTQTPIKISREIKLIDDYQAMTDEQLAEERIRLDTYIEELRNEKRKIQRVLDSRYIPPPPASHTIGGTNG